MTEYEFTPEAVAEAFSNQGLITARLQEENVTPEELAAYLNEEIDQSGRKAIAAMMEDHIIPISSGGQIRIRERNTFEAWKEETGWEAPNGPTD